MAPGRFGNRLAGIARRHSLLGEISLSDSKRDVPGQQRISLGGHLLVSLSTESHRSRWQARIPANAKRHDLTLPPPNIMFPPNQQNKEA
jgi:hypothetical protein